MPANPAPHCMCNVYVVRSPGDATQAVLARGTPATIERRTREVQLKSLYGHCD